MFFSPRLDDLMAGFEDLANVDDAEGASDDVVWAARTTELIKKFEVCSIYIFVSPRLLSFSGWGRDYCC